MLSLWNNISYKRLESRLHSSPIKTIFFYCFSVLLRLKYMYVVIQPFQFYFSGWRYFCLFSNIQSFICIWICILVFKTKAQLFLVTSPVCRSFIVCLKMENGLLNLCLSQIKIIISENLFFINVLTKHPCIYRQYFHSSHRIKSSV